MGSGYTLREVKISTASWKELVIVRKKLLAAFMATVFWAGAAGSAMTVEAAPKPVDNPPVIQQLEKKDKQPVHGFTTPQLEEKEKSPVHNLTPQPIEPGQIKPIHHRPRPRPFHRPPGLWHFHWSFPGHFHRPPPPPPPPPRHFHRPPHHRPGPPPPHRR